MISPRWANALLGRTPTPPADRFERGLWAFILVVILIVLTLAARISPDPRGHGTHEQLGLPPCGFVAMYGVPCPSCGFTTTFALAMHGRFIAAFINQPFGFLLFLLALATIPIALRIVTRRFSLLWASQRWPWWTIITVTILLWLLAWLYKCFLWPRLV